MIYVRIDIVAFIDCQENSKDWSLAIAAMGVYSPHVSTTTAPPIIDGFFDIGYVKKIWITGCENNWIGLRIIGYLYRSITCNCMSSELTIKSNLLYCCHIKVRRREELSLDRASRVRGQRMTVNVILINT